MRLPCRHPPYPCPRPSADALSACGRRLCAPPSNSNRGRPFYPVLAQPFDLFPDTPHCEMVVVLDRISDEMKFYE